MPSSVSDSSMAASPTGLALPSPDMQNQMHELAKTLPPPRRQNIACDACRTRKVKCNQLPDQDRCQHCIAKNYPCTHYVQQATSERKRSASMKRPKNLDASQYRSSPSAVLSKLPANTADSISPTAAQAFATQHAYSLGSPLRHIFSPISSSQTTASQLIAYLFSPDASLGESATHPQYKEIFRRLEDEAFRIEFAFDLVEVYFQICHTRQPLLNPTQFRGRLRLALPLQPGAVSPPATPEKSIHPALLATVLAWGAKFSEHPLLVMDREASGGPSWLAKTLINRARDVAEAQKVHRIASADNVVITLLIEPLQNQNPDDPDGFHGFWLTCAVRHLLDLQINHKSVMSNIQDPEARGTMIFAWWMACLSDAYSSAYYRRKPMLDDEDYDIDFYTADPVASGSADSQGTTPSPREQLEFLGYYRAAHALARISRNMSRQLWRPLTESDGLPFDVLCNFTILLQDWRDEHLPRVGVPNNFEAEWDFVSAVSACASDATYHVMWIILFSAIDDYGIREVNDAVRVGNPSTVLSNHSEIERVKHKILDEALHGALRIAGLAGVLTSNGYLRLDPAVMHVSCIQAGTLLARLGRPEAQNCIAGLQQYSYAYTEAAEQAHEIERLYAASNAGETDINHMSSVVLQPENEDHRMSIG